MAEETNYKDAGEQPPSTVEQQAPSVAEENAPSTTSDVGTDIPTANAPDPKAANPEVNPNAAGEKSSTVASTPDDSAQVQKTPKKTAAAAKADAPAAKAAAKGDAPAAKAAAKKEKAPAVEDKPFANFMQEDCLPALKSAFEKQGVQDLKVALEKQKLAIAGLNEAEECWQVIGTWQGGQRQFNLYFPEENIQGQRAFSCADNGTKTSTLEPFLIDERKVTLDLIVFGVIQRVNAQKWLVRN